MDNIDVKEEKRLNTDKADEKVTKLCEQDDSPNLEDSKPSAKQGRRSTDNIYEYYSEYSLEEVANALKLMSEEDISILHLKYGSDLVNPILNKDMTKEEKRELWSVIYRLGTALKCIREGRKYSPKTKKVDVKTKNAIVNKEKKELKEKEVTSNCDSMKASYIDIYKVFNNEEFVNLTKTKDVKELIILSLYLGYVNNIHFFPDVIADFLDLEVEEVNNIIITNLREYKEILLKNVNNEVEKLLEISISSPKVKKLTPEN